MKTTTKPANRFRRPLSAIISCLGPLLVAGPIASCGTGPSATTTSKPIALRSEYRLKSWHDSPSDLQKGVVTGRLPQFNDGGALIPDNPTAGQDSILANGMENGALLAEVMSTLTGDKAMDSRWRSNDDIALHARAARMAMLNSSLLRNPDQNDSASESAFITSGYWQEQASR